MKRPAVFFDRDNTLIVNDGYLGDPAKVVLMNGAAEAVARARRLGYATVSFSNQSGVARGMFAEEDVQRVNVRMETLLIAYHPEARFDRHEFCPFHPDGIIDVYKRETDRRKPGPGMILSAAEKLGLDLTRSWVVGDAPRDVQAGRAAGCRTILLSAPDVPASPAAGAEENGRVEPDFSVTSLKEALDVIERNPIAEETAAPVAAEVTAEAPTESKPDKPWLVAAQMAKARRANPGLPEPAVPARAALVAAEPDAAPDADNAPISPPTRRAEPAARPLDSGPPPTRMESLAEQILYEVRRRNEQDLTEFSVTKLLAGIVQVMALAAVFLAYMRSQSSALPVYLLTAIFLQMLTVALLLMGRHK